MPAIRHAALDDFFEAYENHPASGELAERWRKITAEATDTGSGKALIEYYEAVTALVEQELWSSGCPDTTLELYQRLFRELESKITAAGNEARFEFVIVIPVADRPQHLEDCLNSLLELCRRFGYGGMANGSYKKISVLLADDSKAPGNIRRNQEILGHFNRQGLKTLYFGQAEQLRQLDRPGRRDYSALQRIVGNNSSPEAFYHKGASITRNIAYLKLAELAREHQHQLFWFIDSDQEFQVNTGQGDRNVTALNYFYHLNQIFSSSDALVLTGKVVGDPPVSPAVMAGNFLQDVIAFLSGMAQLDPQAACQFHDQQNPQSDDAAYHDMANLFGFKSDGAPFQYHCRVNGAHDHAGCFEDFSQKLNRFFDGEHPTRQTRYEPQELSCSVKPARTVYTGNYIFRTSALEYFIPFAPLKLRMAGPVLGRILQAEKEPQFVAANLPMLHKRTVEQLGQSEFRPDIDRAEDLIDLSGEFERQFFGDVMLFSIERLTAQGYPAKPVPEQLVRQTLQEVEASMLQKYTATHSLTLERLASLKALFADPQTWWQRDPACRTANADFERFIRNIEYNFGDDSPGYRMIHAQSHRQQRLQEILEAIMQLPDDRASWRDTLSNAGYPSGRPQA